MLVLFVGISRILLSILLVMFVVFAIVTCFSMASVTAYMFDVIVLYGPTWFYICSTWICMALRCLCDFYLVLYGFKLLSMVSNGFTGFYMVLYDLIWFNMVLHCLILGHIVLCCLYAFYCLILFYIVLYDFTWCYIV